MSTTPSGADGTDGRIDDRIAERRRGVRRERQVTRRRRTLTLAVLLGVVLALLAVERSALVGLESVEVAGLERLTADQVRDAAGLELGTSTVRLRLGAVEGRVRALPLVRSAEVRRIDPLTVRVTVVERAPVLNARGGGQEVLVDRSGVVIDDGRIEGLPVVALRTDLPALGERDEDGGPLDDAVSVWRGLSGPLRAEVVVYRPRVGDLDLQLRSGVRVRFGRAERIDEKVRALGAVLEDVGETTITAVDVRAPARPVVLP